MSTLVAPRFDLDSLLAVVHYLPAHPFTSTDFFNIALGLNAVGNANDVAPMLDWLTAAGAIEALGNTWIRRT